MGNNSKTVYHEGRRFVGEIHYTKVGHYLDQGWQLNLLPIIGDERRVGGIEDLQQIKDNIIWLSNNGDYLDVCE